MTTTTRSTFDRYLQAQSTIAALEDEKTSLVSEISQGNNQLVVLLLTTQDPLQSSHVRSVAELIQSNEKRLADIVSGICIKHNKIYFYYF